MNKKLIIGKQTQIDKQLMDLIQKFDELDSQKTGNIKLSDAINLLYKQFNLKFDDQNFILKNFAQNQYSMKFQQFLALHWQFEMHNKKKKTIINHRILQFIKLLQNYRKICQNSQNYTEADKINQRINEIKSKEIQSRKLNHQKDYQKSLELHIAHQEQKIIEFNKAWDQYLMEYQKAAIKCIQKLKLKHKQQIQLVTNKIKNDSTHKFKYSNEWHQLKNKQKNYLKHKDYKQANNTKLKCQNLEALEKKEYQERLQEKMKSKLNEIRKHHEEVINAHIKYIENDKLNQLKNKKQGYKMMLQQLNKLKSKRIIRENLKVRQILTNIKDTVSNKSQSKRTNSLQKIKNSVKLTPIIRNHLYTDSPMQQKHINEKQERKKIRIRVKSYTRPKFSEFDQISNFL